jgi:DNA-binding protein HU-beta
MADGVVGKKELVDMVAEKGNMTKKAAEGAINAFIESITDSLKAGNSVRIIPFGSFEIRNRGARTGRNPQTGAEIKIEAKKVPVFKPGKSLRDSVI